MTEAMTETLFPSMQQRMMRAPRKSAARRFVASERVWSNRRMARRRVWGAGFVASVMFAVAVGASPRPAGAVAITRTSDPVVLTGAQIPMLLNANPLYLVGFRWTGTTWVQIPIQIDERAVVNFGKIYNNPNATFYGSQVGQVNKLVYTSAATFTGADSNALFDSNDELVFMGRDTGLAAPSGSTPAQAQAGSGVRIRVTDPLVANSIGYVYLFKKTAASTLQPGAGKKYVNYAFTLLSGDYKTTYQLTSGPNLENSTVTGASYRRHFSDRWLSDEIRITLPSATNVDILDRHKALFAPGFCSRSEDTFDIPSPGTSVEGAFVINKNGPVRAIRSYVGANSGPSTQRTHVFYDRREDIRSDLRVHSIPSVLDFMDYSAAASGMRYRNSLNHAGVIVNGTPDAITAGSPTWEQLAGVQGTVTHVGIISSSFAYTAAGYYYDDSTPATTQCTGDAFAYGSSGSWITSTLPCTDPGLGCTANFASTRVVYYDGPGGTATTAAARRSQAVTALQAAAFVHT